MIRYRKIALALTMCGLCGQPVAGPIEQKWGPPLQGPFGLKQYVVSILHMQSQPDFEEQIRQVGEPTAALLRNIDVMPLLYAFDSLQSKRDIEDLAGLTAYYMGAAAEELYECLVLRKGEEIKACIAKARCEEVQ